MIIHLVSLKFSSAFPSHHFLFAFYFINLVLIPGHLISSVIHERCSPVVRIMLSFLLGTALFYLMLTLFYAMHLKTYYIGIIIPIISLFMLFLPVLRGSKIRKKHPEGLPPPNVPGYSHTALIVMLVLVCVLISISGNPLIYSSDAPDHIACIKAISRTGEAFPEQFLYRNGGTLTRDIRKGLVHAMWGTINSLTGRSDVHDIWPLISMIGSIFIILSLFGAGILIFRSASIGLLSAMLFILIYRSGLKGNQLLTIAYPFPFGKIYLIMFLSFLLLYLACGGKKHLALTATASFAACGTHINHFLIIVFLTFVFSLVKLFQSSGERKKVLWKRTVPILCIILVAVNLPYLALRFFRDYAPNNAIHTHVQAVLRLADNVEILNPVVFFKHAGPLFILAVVSIFVLWRKSRLDVNLRLLLWGVISVLALVFNPLVTPFLKDKISYLLMRFEIAIPSMIVSSYLLYELWKKSRGWESSVSRGRVVVGWIAVALLIGYPLVRTPLNFAYSGKNLSNMQQMSCTNLEELYASINGMVPSGSVILSDPVTSYCIPAFTDQFVVCTYDQHSIPNDSTALDRILECREIFLPGVPLGNIIRILEKYKAEYIVINGRIPQEIATMYWKPDRKVAEALSENLSNVPEVFKKLYDKNSVSLFSFTDSPDFDSLHAVPIPMEVLGPRVTLEETLGFPESGEAGIYIKDVRLSRDKVQRGGTLDLSISWVTASKCNPSSYNTLLRFNTNFRKGPLYSQSYGKIYRKIYERFRGVRFRFSTVHPPLGGIYPPDLWPPLRIIRDDFRVQIPEDISPGTYTVSIKLVRTVQYANYTLGDILTDDDYGSGAVMGEIIVE